MATTARRKPRDLDTAGTRFLQVAALTLSATHIVTVALDHGASHLDALTAPAIIDVPLLLCVRGMRPAYTKATRVTGLVGALFFGLVSLAANILSGLEHSPFGAAIGALAVVGYLFAEIFGHIRKPAPRPRATAKPRAAAARKAPAKRPTKPRKTALDRELEQLLDSQRPPESGTPVAA